MPTPNIDCAVTIGLNTYDRNPVGLSLVNYDATAFDGFANLQSWSRKHHWQFVEGQAWTQNRPYSQSEIPPIAFLSRLLGYPV